MKRVAGVFRYMIHEATRPVLIFYLVILLWSGFFTTMSVTASNWSFEFGGLRLATTIFLFVMGLNSFKPGYLFLQANGVTRREFYLGGLAALSAAVVAFTAIDTLLNGLLRLILLRPDRSIQLLLYPNSGAAGVLAWTLAFNLLAAAFGWFLTMLYYRSGKGLKISISLLPAVIIVGLPIVSDTTGGQLIHALARAFLAVMGLGGAAPNVWIGVLTMMVTSAALAGLCFLLVRRAPVKEQER